jgi:predicted nucleic acid-binding protein
MSDMVVVDASLALKWVIPASDSSIAITLLDKWTNEGIRVIAPALFVYEVTNILYRQSTAGKLTYDEATQSLKKLFSIGVLLKFSLYEDISAQAMEFARLFNLPATYDAHYLALAQHENSELWTADTRLWNALKRKLSWVHWIGDNQP